MDALEQTLNYRFQNRALLEQALTHPSAHKRINNQRLEFLGDAVLGLLVARLLYDMFPDENEGDMARRHAALVCGDTLVKVAVEMGLGEHLKLAVSEAASGGRETPSNLEDGCEALIGAMYLDGGLEAASVFVTPRWQALARQVSSPPKDAKTGLQEWAQARGLSLPAYTVVSSKGPAHAPAFTIEVRVDGQEPATATANSKRTAEQMAAGELLGRL